MLTLANSSSFSSEWILNISAHFCAFLRSTLNWVVELPLGAIKTPNVSIPIAGSIICSLIGILDESLIPKSIAKLSGLLRNTSLFGLNS